MRLKKEQKERLLEPITAGAKADENNEARTVIEPSDVIEV
jgi:hypothetical protein